jgi:uncharacterized protein (DUF924 family)
LSGGAGVEPDGVIAFWQSAGPEKWFKKDADLDRAIAERFATLHAEAAAGGRRGWAESPNGALALVLILDQFSRNMFRGLPKAFAQDDMAVAVSVAAIDAGFDAKVAPELRAFFFMPFMHAERISDQERCMRLCHACSPGNLPYAREHAAIIRRFGRFPHRNAILGRHTSPTEQAFLDAGGFGG